MNITKATAQCGLPAKTIRYYDEIGLVTPPRDSNGYRSFDEKVLHKLSFVAHARELGFTIEDCRTLLALYEDDARASADVKRIAKQHLSKIDQKIKDLNAMRGTLSHLINECAGNDKPDCPILNNFSKTKSEE
jgi:MerR family copper efflux transcriptional regulator